MSRRKLSKTKIITFAALMAAVSVIIGFICKSYFTFGIGLRITFESLPIVLAAIVCGPVVGGLVGIASDLIACLSSGQSLIPMVTVGAGAIGVVAGMVSRFILRRKSVWQIILAEILSHAIGSCIIKTIGLVFRYYKTDLLAAAPMIFGRLGIYLIIIVVESLILILLFRNKLFRKALPDFLT